jgi:hypothetical protein
MGCVGTVTCVRRVGKVGVVNVAGTGNEKGWACTVEASKLKYWIVSRGFAVMPLDRRDRHVGRLQSHERGDRDCYRLKEGTFRHGGLLRRNSPVAVAN